MKRLQTIALLALLFSFSCKKQDNAPTTTVTYEPVTIYIVNNVGYPVTLRLYASVADYRNSSNALVSLSMAQRDVYKYTVENPGKNLYVDWYTDDYIYTNWGTQRTSFSSFLPDSISTLSYAIPFSTNGTPVINDSLYLDYERYTSPYLTTTPAYNMGMRQYYLNGNNAQTHWHAVDVQNTSGISLWSGLPQEQRNADLTLYKDQTYKLNYYYNNSTVTDSSFYLNDFSRPPACSLLGRTATNVLFSGTVNNQRPYASDTCRLMSYPYVYVFVRDK